MTVGAVESTGPSRAQRLTHSLPGSPTDRKPPPCEVIGSAENLVSRILNEEGLGQFCDPDFVRHTSREIQIALDMTQEEMDRAAHQILQQEKCLQQDYATQQSPEYMDVSSLPPCHTSKCLI